MPLITTFMKVSADVLCVYKYIHRILSVNEGKSWKTCENGPKCI